MDVVNPCKLQIVSLLPPLDASLQFPLLPQLQTSQCPLFFTHNVSSTITLWIKFSTLKDYYIRLIVLYQELVYDGCSHKTAVDNLYHSPDLPYGKVSLPRALWRMLLQPRIWSVVCLLYIYVRVVNIMGNLVNCIIYAKGFYIMCGSRIWPRDRLWPFPLLKKVLKTWKRKKRII